MTSQLERDERDVQTLLAVEEGLSAWEVGYAESLAEWVVDERKTLTDRQREKLDEILRAKGL